MITDGLVLRPVINSVLPMTLAPQSEVFSRVPVSWSEEAELLTLPSQAGNGLHYACKRIVDVAISAVLLVLLAPLLCLIALAIKIDSPGPVLYSQKRVGSRRRRKCWEIRLFPCYKFRSMRCDADEAVHRAYIQRYCGTGMCAGLDATTIFKLSNDDRITRVGALLRRSSLDELPQLLDVLLGHMSLVGPRPVPSYEVTHYRHEDYERFTATSGMTGLWQVRGRGRVTFEEMMRMDIEYARHPSLWLDVKLLLLTIPAVVTGRGAR